MKRTALFIAYYFPPLGGIGAHRSVKFIKYLKDFGWEAQVLTVSESIDYTRDESLFEDLPSDIAITRASHLDSKKLTRWLGKRKFHWLRDQVQQALNTVLVPDTVMPWCLPAVLKGLSQAKQCDVIFSTSSPYSSHLVGAMLHQLTGKPWVADFRDEWTQNPYIQFPSRLHQRMHHALERSVFTQAQHITTVTSVIHEEFAQLYPEAAPRITTIPNGFDPAMFEFLDNWPPPHAQPNAKFTLAYTGSFYGGITPEPFFQALKQSLDSGVIPSNKLRLVFAGNTGKFAFDYPGVEFIRHGYLPHQDALQTICQSDLLLLMIPESRGSGAYSGKVFDYFGSQRPILGMIPRNGILEELLEKSGLARITGFSDVDAIRLALVELYRLWESSGGHLYRHVEPNHSFIQQYSRKNGTQALVSIFNQLVKSQPTFKEESGALIQR